VSIEDREASAIQALRDQGYEVGEQAMQQDGFMRIGVRSRDASAWVNVGVELVELAAGRVTLDEITNRRRTEQKATPEAQGLPKDDAANAEDFDLGDQGQSGG
jgi:hypothetical protein